MEKGLFLLIAGLLTVILFPAAYGTAAQAPACHPSIAYDSRNNRYLVVYPMWDDVREEYDLYGKLLNADGTPYKPEFVISNAPRDQYVKQPISSVAYDSNNQRFLVVWEDGRNYPNDWVDLYGQLVNADGSLYGTDFVISNATESQSYPGVAYDSINQRFLVAWTEWRDWRSKGGDIYGQMVNANGTLIGTDFVITNAPLDQWLPSIAYDSVNQRFLVTWHGYISSDDTNIYGKLINPDGTLYGADDILICNAVEYQWDVVVAYDSANQKFLVVWLDRRNISTTYADIYGQLMNADGSLSGSNFVISNAPKGQFVPAVAYDSVNHRFLAVWYHYISGVDDAFTADYDIYGQLVNADGTLNGANLVITDAADTQRCPTVAFNPNCANFLVAFTTKESGIIDIGIATVGDLNCPPEDSTNGIDDDGDGLVDCNDPDCESDLACLCQCPEDSIPPIGCISGMVTKGGTRMRKRVTIKRTFPTPKVKAHVKTNSNGCYSFTDLEDGTYEIKVRHCRGGGTKTVNVNSGGKINDVNFQCK